MNIYLLSQCELKRPLIVVRLSFNTQWRGVNDAPSFQSHVESAAFMEPQSCL